MAEAAQPAEGASAEPVNETEAAKPSSSMSRREELELKQMELDIMEREQRIKEKELELKERAASLQKKKLAVSSENAVSIEPKPAAAPTPEAKPAASKDAGKPTPKKEEIPLDLGSGDLANKVLEMRAKKDAQQQQFKSNLSSLEKQTKDAAAEKDRRLKAAKTLAEEAVREAQSARVTEVANLVAALLSLEKKAVAALDQLVLLLVDAVDAPPPSAEGAFSVESRLVPLMAGDKPPSLKELEEAVAALEAIKPKAESAQVKALQEELAALQKRIDKLASGKAAAAEASAPLPAPAAVPAAAPAATEGKKGPGDLEVTGAAPAAAKEEVPAEYKEKIESLQMQKKYLQEIAELEAQVTSLKEQQQISQPPPTAAVEGAVSPTAA